jgi:hypothetical protein
MHVWFFIHGTGLHTHAQFPALQHSGVHGLRIALDDDADTVISLHGAQGGSNFAPFFLRFFLLGRFPSWHFRAWTKFDVGCEYVACAKSAGLHGWVQASTMLQHFHHDEIVVDKKCQTWLNQVGVILVKTEAQLGRELWNKVRKARRHI